MHLLFWAGNIDIRRITEIFLGKQNTSQASLHCGSWQEKFGLFLNLPL